MTQRSGRRRIARWSRAGWGLLATLALIAALVVHAGAQTAPGDGGSGSEETTRVRVALNGYENNLTPFTLTFGSLPNTHDMSNLV